MAVTAIEILLLRDLKKLNILPQNADLLEFGESNWYGDASVNDLKFLMAEFVTDKEKLAALNTELDGIKQGTESAYFNMAKIFFRAVVGNKSYTAVDLSGTEIAKKLDLNQQIDLGQQFDITFNFGTGEHVFNVHQFFKNIHDSTKPGGIMIHGMPFSGWYDHGFYNFQPTFYFDLAKTNGYKIEAMLYTELKPPKLVPLTSREQILEMAKNKQVGEFSLIYAVLRKAQQEAEFKTPMQSLYFGEISAAAKESWKKLRA